MGPPNKIKVTVDVLDGSLEVDLSDTIRVLSEVQKIDLELDVIEREKERCCSEIEESKSEGDDIKEKVTLLTEALDTLEVEGKDLEEGLRVNKETITKDNERLGEIKNDKQFKAITKEISNAEKSVKLLEMESSALSERVAEKREEIAGLEAKSSEKTDAAGTLVKKLEENNAEWAKEIEGKSKEREALIVDIPSNILKKYDTIRARRAGIGIVTVERETCQGCFIQIPPQVYIQLRRDSDGIINCPHCYRFLYFDGESEVGAESTSNEAESSMPADEA